MKISIITFSVFNDNYGQLMQAFALQRYLQQKGHEVTHIKYTREISHKDDEQNPIPISCKKRIRAFIVQNIFVPYRLYLNRKFRKRYPCSFSDFESKYINYYPTTYRCIQDLWANPPVADCYICGSDQIWNTGTVANSKAYYLDFGSSEVKRIAFAPSFGRFEINVKQGCATIDSGTALFLKKADGGLI